jgi:hypothetical protein
MLFELLAVSMMTPNTTLISQNTENKYSVQTVKDTTLVPDIKSEGNVTYKYILPRVHKLKYDNFSEVVSDYFQQAKDTIVEFQLRYKNDGQFLKWVTLPDVQLYKKMGVSHVDSIYEQANALAMRKESVLRPLVVLGIGGSKHTAEFLLNMTGYDRKRPVYFYSDIDPISYKNFLSQVNVGVQNLNFLVVSKSGTTFETSDAFRRFENDLINYYQSQGLEVDLAIKKAQKHFALCTDAKATDKNLRGKVGSKNGYDNGYLKELYIHDDVGGRYSMFDDAGLFVLAYAGVPKETTERILKGASLATQYNLNEKNIAANAAIQGAIYNVFSRDYGFKIIQQQYFGKLFEGGGENWAKQLYLESLKDFDYIIGKAPDSMHYSTEGHFSPQNRDKYNTIMTIMNPNIAANYNKYVGAIAMTYAETAPVKVEVLAIENNAIKPESIGEYIQTKHFETIYMGILRRLVSSQNTRPDVLPEVLQPSVETYKNKFKPGSPFELNPGEK